MPTVLALGSIRVVIYTNDHPPAHVHATRGDEARAKFELNCPDGPVQLVEHAGFRLAEINWIGRAVTENLEAICARWRAIHG